MFSEMKIFREVGGGVKVEGKGEVGGGGDWLKASLHFWKKHGKDCWFARSLRMKKKWVDYNLSKGLKVKLQKVKSIRGIFKSK